MSVTITWQFIAWLIGLGVMWTGFLLGAIKWLLNRQITSLENRLAEAESSAKHAKDVVGKHKDEVTASISALRLELNQKLVCGNHDRMERTDQTLQAKLEKIDRCVSRIEGHLGGVDKMVEMLTQNELTGGKG